MGMLSGVCQNTLILEKGGSKVLISRAGREEWGEKDLPLTISMTQGKSCDWVKP